MSNKHLKLFLMMNRWVRVKQEGMNLASYFEDKGYKKIAIYGMSYAGETLVEELQGTAVQVAYGIDQNTRRVIPGIEIVLADAEFEDVDVIVVTAITYFDEIKKCLSAKAACPVVSLEDILYEV